MSLGRSQPLLPGIESPHCSADTKATDDLHHQSAAGAVLDNLEEPGADSSAETKADGDVHSDATASHVVMDNLDVPLLRLRKHDRNESTLHRERQVSLSGDLQAAAWRLALRGAADGVSVPPVAVLKHCNSPSKLADVSELAAMFSALDALRQALCSADSGVFSEQHVDWQVVERDCINRQGEVVALAMKSSPFEGMALMTRLLAKGPQAHAAMAAAMK